MHVRNNLLSNFFCCGNQVALERPLPNDLRNDVHGIIQRWNRDVTFSTVSRPDQELAHERVRSVFQNGNSELDLSDLVFYGLPDLSRAPRLTVLDLSGAPHKESYLKTPQYLANIHHLKLGRCSFEDFEEFSDSLARLRRDSQFPDSDFIVRPFRLSIQFNNVDNEFNNFLTKLLDRNNARGGEQSPLEVGLISLPDVIKVLEECIGNTVLQEKYVDLARDANTACNDRVLTRFNDMQVLAEVSRLQRDENQFGHDNARKIFDLVQKKVHQTLIDEQTLPLMTKQWKEGRRTPNGQGTGPNTHEALEVQLELRRQLGRDRDFPLPFPIRDTLYSRDQANLTADDITFVRAKVREELANEALRLNRLIAEPTWRDYLQQKFQHEFEVSQQQWQEQAYSAMEQAQLVYDESMDTCQKMYENICTELGGSDGVLGKDEQERLQLALDRTVENQRAIFERRINAQSKEHIDSFVSQETKKLIQANRLTVDPTWRDYRHYLQQKFQHQLKEKQQQAYSALKQAQMVYDESIQEAYKHIYTELRSNDGALGQDGQENLKLALGRVLKEQRVASEQRRDYKMITIEDQRKEHLDNFMKQKTRELVQTYRLSL